MAIRVEKLERQVAGLASLPDRMTALELQVLQFRAEVRMEFSAVREEMQAGFLEMRAGLQEMRAGLEETQRHMRVLHEDVIQRIATLGEARPSGSRSAGRRPKR